MDGTSSVHENIFCAGQEFVRRFALVDGSGGVNASLCSGLCSALPDSATGRLVHDPA